MTCEVAFPLALVLGRRVGLVCLVGELIGLVLRYPVVLFSLFLGKRSPFNLTNQKEGAPFSPIEIHRASALVRSAWPLLGFLASVRHPRRLGPLGASGGLAALCGRGAAGGGGRGHRPGPLGMGGPTDPADPTDPPLRPAP